MKRVQVFRIFDVLWHLALMFAVFGLMITGFEIHGTYRLIGMRFATTIHDVLMAFVILHGFLAVLYHLVTSALHHYVPSGKKLAWYFGGSMGDSPYPTDRVEVTHKLPLQYYVNVAFKLMLWGFMAITGALYIGFVIFHDSMQKIFDRSLVAGLHTAGAFIMVCLVMAHTYMAFLGRNGSFIRAIFTGYEEETPHVEVAHE
jgi:cytochrome b subunit of formate dehydrogenase